MLVPSPSSAHLAAGGVREVRIREGLDSTPFAGRSIILIIIIIIIIIIIVIIIIIT